MFRKGIAVLMGTCGCRRIGGCGSSANTGETTNVQADEQVQCQKHPMKSLIMPYRLCCCQ